jgi:hypothetical protein
MPRLLAAVLLLPLALGAGCMAPNPHHHGGEFVAEYRPGEKAEATTAPYQATYALYEWPKPPEGPAPHTWNPDTQATELYVRGLDRCDKVGFEKSDKGELLAVAGEEKIPLEPGRYCWHITTATEYHGVQRVLHETGENVVAIVALPCVTVMWCCTAPLLLVGWWAL